MATPGTSQHDRRGEVIGLTVFMISFSSCFLFGRLYTRIFKTKAFGWDDTFLVVSIAAGIAGEGLTVAEAKHGLGLSITELAVPDIVKVVKYTTFAVFCNGIAMGTMKIGIGFSLLRIQLSKRFNVIVICCMVLSAVVNFIVFPGTFGTCRPMQKNWNSTVPGSCWPRKASLVFSYVQTVGNIITDLLFSLGPLYYLSRVKVSRYNRWALRGVFLIGLLATGCAIAKATQLPVLEKTTDPTAAPATLTILVVAEYSAGIFAASLPPLKATFERILVRVFGVQSGLQTSLAARKAGYTHPTDRSSRVGHRLHTGSAGVQSFQDDVSRGGAAYMMTDLWERKKGHDQESLEVEDDQKHILFSGSVKTTTGSDGEASDSNHGPWITKTVDVSVVESRRG